MHVHCCALCQIVCSCLTKPLINFSPSTRIQFRSTHKHNLFAYVCEMLKQQSTVALMSGVSYNMCFSSWSSFVSFFGHVMPICIALHIHPCACAFVSKYECEFRVFSLAPNVVRHSKTVKHFYPNK